MNNNEDRQSALAKLDHYEEGSMLVEVRDKWWKFWLPKQVAYGTYVRVGSIVSIHIKQVPVPIYYTLPEGSDG